MPVCSTVLLVSPSSPAQNDEYVLVRLHLTAGCTHDAATEWNLVMATAMLALLPPALVVVLMQKWFVKGLVETEK